MKKLYKDLFYVPKYGKVQECTMTARAVLSLTVILLCLASMAITAYAWFSYNISSATIRLTAARFSTVAVIRQKDGGSEVTVDSSEDGIHTVKLTGGIEYEVVLTRAIDCTAKTGFCILSGAGIGSYHTLQLGQDGNAWRDGTTFYLTPDKDMQITLQDHWGTSSSYGDPNATNRIAEKQTLILSTKITAPKPTTPSTTAATTGAPTTEVPTQMLYEVQEGDTLTAIAQRYGVTVEELCQINGIEDPNVILVGAQLQIPMTDEEG